MERITSPERIERVTSAETSAALSHPSKSLNGFEFAFAGENARRQQFCVPIKAAAFIPSSSRLY
jgi:hypothetical protein